MGNYRGLWFSKCSVNQKHLEGLLIKFKFIGPTLRVSDSVGVGWGLSVCISKFPGDACLGATLRTTETQADRMLLCFI